MKVSALTGSALDWAVAKCEGAANIRFDGKHTRISTGEYFDPSTDWAQSGPIIEREKLCVGYKHQCDPDYCPINDPATNCWARTTAGGYLKYGPTPLIAAMRCYVASKLGDEIEIPKELL
jgi:Protein of unknown function (DUF2591)